MARKKSAPGHASHDSAKVLLEQAHTSEASDSTVQQQASDSTVQQQEPAHAEASVDQKAQDAAGSDSTACQRRRGRSWCKDIMMGLTAATVIHFLSPARGEIEAMLWRKISNLSRQSKPAAAYSRAAAPPTTATKISERRVKFSSNAEFRADLYLDNGLDGVFQATVLPGGQNAIVKIVHVGERYFYTPHGSHEILVNSKAQRIKRTIRQDTQSFILPKDARRQEGCVDRHDFCAREANNGRCSEIPGYMIPNCCASCDVHINASALLDGKVRCRREFLNTTATRAWRPGDLQKMFENIVNNKRLAAFRPRTILSPPDGPWVVVLDKFLDANECAALIKVGEEIGFTSSKIEGNKSSGGEQTATEEVARTSSSAFCIYPNCRFHPSVMALKRKVKQVTGIATGNHEFQLLSYAPGEYYRSHTDVAPKMRQDAAGLRILTVFLYLSDVVAGGETAFPSLGLKVSPKKGSVLIFPNVLNENPNEVDDRVLHEAVTVEKGLKKAANLWVHQYDFDTAYHWGC